MACSPRLSHCEWADGGDASSAAPVQVFLPAVTSTGATQLWRPAPGETTLAEAALSGNTERLLHLQNKVGAARDTECGPDRVASYSPHPGWGACGNRARRGTMSCAGMPWTSVGG